jgi:hypothetical protein
MQPNSDAPPPLPTETASETQPPGTETESTASDIPPGIRRSTEAFRRDLPELLKVKKLFRRWVAYHGEERIGIARCAADLYTECRRRGLREEDFAVCCIVPEMEECDNTPLYPV